jgi:polyisoprenoid-binding protein YceI
MKTIKTILAIFMLFATTQLFAQKVKFTADNSTIKWHGAKVTGEHDGSIQLKDGYLKMEDGNISGGKFHIDMTTIENRDIEDAEYNAKLVGHLKSDDFFGVETYPVSTLEIKEATPFKDGKAKVKAHLTIKKTTLPVEFEVTQKDGKMMTEIVVDRAKYDVRYGSGSFFDNLGDKMIYDEFTMNVTLNTKSN